MEEKKELTHFDSQGHAVMVDVTDKKETIRTAYAVGRIVVGREALACIESGTAAKGDVLGVARVAGIMGAKKTAELIPLCHILPLTKCSIDFKILPEASAVEVGCLVKTEGKTGVEMEALTGVNIALLTIYDMCKAIDKGMRIEGIHLVEKTGGKSGVYRWKEL